MPVLSRAEVEAGVRKNLAPAEASPVSEAEKPLPPATEPIEPGKPRASAGDPWFSLQHPDACDGNRIDATIEVAGETVEIERSRVETQSLAVRDDLIRRGWRWMNEVF